jgi:hypothetical protein
MNQSTANGGAAIFAAHGSARQRIARAAIAGGAGLLAAWLIALALGVLGGFGSLPGLPSSHSSGPREASTRVHRQAANTPARPHATEADNAEVVTPTTIDTNSSRSGSPSVTPKATTPKAVQPPSTSTAATTTATTHGKSGQTTTGKPAGSPGNGAGGSGAPGQLR